jgi:hypothetical protein
LISLKSSLPSSGGGGTATTAIAISRTSIQPLEVKNNKIDGVSDEYSLHAKNRDKSQQILAIDVKSIQNDRYQSTKLFDEGKSNNLFSNAITVSTKVMSKEIMSAM